MIARLALLLALAGCDADGGPLAPTDPAKLSVTLDDLAAFGEKRVGTEPGKRAGEYVRGRMVTLGLTDVHLETFHFPRHDVSSQSMAISIDGIQIAPAISFEVFEGSGPGHAAGDVVWAGGATDTELVGQDLTGKVALVERLRTFHRSSQFKNVAAKGAVAMLYLSVAPDNLRQIGSVRRSWESMGPIPAITVGATDGATIKNAVMAGKKVTATIDVAAASTPAEGANVIARIPGKDPDHQIVIGAHYDTWFTGSSDNGGGVAALLALAQRRLEQSKPAYTLVFVAFDGEEVALYGGYHFLRLHKVVTDEPILAVLNLETPSAAHSTLWGLARSNVAALDEAIRGADLNLLYAFYAALDTIPTLFGGIIPTDIQGIYRSGIPTASTAVDSPYYHTTADTPDKVDTTALAEAVDKFDVALDKLLATPPAAFAPRDPKLWTAEIAQRPRTAGQPLLVDVTLRDGSGALKAAPVQAALLYDDFFLATEVSAMSDASGKATLTLPAPSVEMSTTNRFLHITAGPSYPLVEQVLAVP